MINYHVNVRVQHVQTRGERDNRWIYGGMCYPTQQWYEDFNGEHKQAFQIVFVFSSIHFAPHINGLFNSTVQN